MEKTILTVFAASVVCFGSGRIRQRHSFIGLGKLCRRLLRRDLHQNNRKFMNSRTNAAKIAILFAIARMFTTLLVAQGTNYEGPVGVTGIFNGNITTACSYDPLTHSAHRGIDDIIVPGSIGKYPLKMTRYYNSRQQYYATPGAIGLSPGWAHEYSWLLWTSGHKVVSPHGNVYDDTCGPPVGVSEGWEGSHSASAGTWRLADGGKVIFSSGRVTDIYDPYGQRTRIAYDGSNQRVKVTEPGGRCLWFTYGTQDQDGTKLLTLVQAYDVDGSPGSPTAPTGHVIEWVSYTYTSTPSGGSGPNKLMLTGVTYSDGTSASYTYQQDNVPENGTSHKMYPLVQRCDDVRYNGPMRTIFYDYQNGGPHGAIIDEKNPSVGAVSSIAPGVPSTGYLDTYTETRGDGPPRSFTYTHMMHCQGNGCGQCDDYENNNPPQQMLLNYTDFRGNTTYLGYDNKWYVNSVTDARGSGPGDPNYTTTYARASPPPTGIGQVTKITHPDTTHIDYAYQSESGAIGGHYLQQITDERGDITYYTRDPNTHVVTRIDYKNAAGTVLAYETFTYNPFGQVQTHRLKNGANENFVYDARGLLTDKFSPKFDSIPGGADPHIHYDYYTSADGKLGWIDRVKKMTLPPNYPNNLQATETYEYDRALGAGGLTDPNGAAVAGRGLVTKAIHADTPSDTFQQFGYDAYGNKRQAWDELSHLTRYTYDDYKRLISVIDPLGNPTQYDYAPTPGNTTQALQHTTSSVWWLTSPSGIITKNVYDENFRDTQTIAAYGTSQAATTWFNYDAVGNRTWVVDPRSTPGHTYPNGDVGYTTYTDYDARDRKWRIREPLSRTTQFYYDDGINITRIIRADQTTETKVYDGMNRLISDTLPKSSNPNVNILTQFVYYPSSGDANGHFGGLLQHVIDGNNCYYTFEYDALGSKTKMTYPGNVSYQTWAYDGAHNLMSRTTLNNETEYFYYDIRNRQNAIVWSNWANNIADWRSFGYDAASRLVEAENGTNGWGANIISDVHRSYDAASHLTLDQQIVTGLGTYNVNYPSYNDDGQLTRMYVSGVTDYDFTFSYDQMGRFEKIFITNGGQLFQYHYDAASNEVERDNLVNGVTDTYPHDALNRMQSMDVRGSLPISHEEYTYSAMNRLTNVTRGTQADAFIYYLDGELKQATYQNNARIVNYALDNAGNRTSVTDNVNGNTSYTPNSYNQYTAVSGNSIHNGPEHEVQTFNGITYTYINDEHLTQVDDGTNTYNLVYDALGRCVKRIFNGVTTYYIYDGEKPILEYNSSGGRVGYNLYGKGIDEILKRGANGSDNTWHWYYFDQDHQGSILDLTDASANVLERYKYDAFGAPTIYDAYWGSRSNTGYDNRFLFTGREYAATYRGIYNVPAFNFYEYRARAYSAQLGRFMSEDRKVFDAGDYNLFRYCHNDPIDFTDPMGLEINYAQTGPPISGNHITQAMEMERAYGEIMAAAQMRFSGGIAAGMAGYQMYSAVSQAVSIAEQVHHPVNFNISMGLDPRQNWNRDIHATVFSGGNDPTDRTNPAFLDRKLGPNELGAALPGGNELRGRSIEVVYTRTGARQNVIPVLDKGPWFDGTLRRPADRYWNMGARPIAESTRANKSGLDLSPQVWRNFGFGIRYDRYGVPYPTSRYDADPVFDWRFH